MMYVLLESINLILHFAKIYQVGLEGYRPLRGVHLGIYRRLHKLAWIELKTRMACIED